MSNGRSGCSMAPEALRIDGSTLEEIFSMTFCMVVLASREGEDRFGIVQYAEAF